MTGGASTGQRRIHEIAYSNYNSTPRGLSGNEDCGQMSAWWLFSALGWYPVDPVSGDYVVGTPFFDSLTLNFPGTSKPLVISAPGASSKGEVYVKSLRVNGKKWDQPVINHSDFSSGGEVVFEMSATPQAWGSAAIWNGGEQNARNEDDGFYMEL